jgi:DNA-binding transcriptional regulator YiaG
MDKHHITLTIDGREYVAIPREQYTAAHEQVEALPFAKTALGADLKRARLTAKLTQVQLAERLGKSQTLVAQAESGKVDVSARYVAGVLQACGLPKYWPAKSASGR